MFATIQRRLGIFATFLMCLLSANVVFAQSCPEIVQTVLENVNEICRGIGRNQACFGNIALSATSQPDALPSLR